MTDFGRLLHAEWTKFRTVRGWAIGLTAAAAVIIGLGLFPGMTGSCGKRGPGSECVMPVGPEGQEVTDAFTFVHRPLAGDGSITVRVAALTGQLPAAPGSTTPRSGPAAWAKAGLIVKDGTRRGSTYAAVMVTGGHGVRLQHDFVHDRAGRPGTATTSSPRWLRLTRAGAVVTAEESVDGTAWTGVGTVRLTGLPATAEVGMFVTSPQFTEAFGTTGAAGSPTRSTAGFDHIDTTGSWQSDTWTIDRIGGDDAPAADRAADGDPAGGGATGGATGNRAPADGDDPSVGAEATGDGFTVTGSGDIAPSVAGAAGSGTSISQTLVGTFAGLVLVVVIGAMTVTGEYRRGLIRTSLAAGPRRGVTLAAKATVVGAVSFVAGLVAATVVVTLGPGLMRDNGVYVHPASTATEVRVIVGTAALMAVAAVLALAFGVLLRRGTAAVTVAIVATVLPYLLAMTVLPAGAGAWLLRVTPAAAFAVQQSSGQYAQVDGWYTPVNGYFPLPPWGGLAVLLGWTAVAFALAVSRFRRRDV